MDSSVRYVNRRQFLELGALFAVGAATVNSTALSYSQILGANYRISPEHIGLGNRASELDGIAGQLSQFENVEMTAVCDLWVGNLDRAVTADQKLNGKAPRALPSPSELLALKDVDAVLISTPVHTPWPLLKMTVDAGKDAYCEKLMGNVLAEGSPEGEPKVFARAFMPLRLLPRAGSCT